MSTQEQFEAWWASVDLDGLPPKEVARRAAAFSEAAAIERCAKVLDRTWFKSQADCVAAIRALLKTDGGAP